MSSGDATLALERHATSKIATLADLSRIKSYGFRGEALPSIASVSRFTLRTRERDDDAGTEVLVEGGAGPVVRPCGAAPGTTVEVRDLFFNVPARRKFLRSLATESAHVTEVAEAAALASPERTLILAREGRVVREWLRAENREQRVTAALPTTRSPSQNGVHCGEAFSHARSGCAAASALTSS
jgi:DNA mismatch repair protein MutL